MALSFQKRAMAGWCVLGILLALTLARAATAPRERWPGLVGDEATYLMQAESLAFDGDLRFGPEDLARFRVRHGHSPEVILQSGDGGARIVYGKPFLYAAAIAPLVRVMGERGALVTNVLALAAAALLAGLALVRQGREWGPLWIAVALFGSVAFGHVFWIHPDLFLMASTASGLALAHLQGTRIAAAPRRAVGSAVGWALAGALLALPGAWRPPYLLLLLPGAFLAAGGGARRGDHGALATPSPAMPNGHTLPGLSLARGGLVAFGAGVAVVAIASLAGQHLVSGSWSPYAGERRGFSDLEGFPGVDFPASDWSQRVASKGNTSWLGEGTLEASASPSLLGWNFGYLLAGRTVGLAPYFLPAIAALFRRRASAATRLESLAGMAVPLVFMVVRPWNVYGGAGSLGNRYFLPAFPLFWFGGGGLARCVVTTVLAAPFLSSLWAAPAAYPMIPGDGFRYVTPAARRLLPVETTQRHVKAPGRADVVHGDLWVRFLDGGMAPSPQNPETLVLHASRRSEILIGRASPIHTLSIEAVGGVARSLRASGAGTEGTAAPPATSILRFERPTARHPMWWTGDPFWIYRIELSADTTTGRGTVEVRLLASSPRQAAAGAP